MTKTKFTPGPWRYQEKSDAYTHIVRTSHPERFLCQLAQDTSGEAEANARLIAAAPELFQALSEIKLLFQSALLCTNVELAKEGMEYVKRADAILAKASPLPPHQKGKPDDGR